MKRLGMVLGSILVVSAVASAKEVVVQPVMVEEPVMIEEVMIEESMLEKTSEFKSTGWIRLQSKYYSKGEHKSVSGNYTRTELTGSLSLTEKDEFYFRTRAYDTLSSAETNQTTTGDRIRADLRWWHDLGNLLDSKIGIKTQLHYEQRAYKDGNSNFKRGTAYLELQFSEYMSWTPEWFKNSSFSFAPKVRYVKSEAGDTNNYMRYGADLYTSWALPLGFVFDWNAYYNNDNYGTVAEFNRDYKQANDFTTEFYLSNRWTLAKSMDENQKLSFGFTGGLDDYGNYEYKNKAGKAQEYYEYYAELDLRVDHKVNNSLGVFMYAGAEYRNFNEIAVSSAQGWTWRPMAGAGFKATF
ncbi:MAG: FomA family porin-like outer membrane protein [Fusobacteriaceae bacterium]